jgi:hypothetical protein
VFPRCFLLVVFFPSFAAAQPYYTPVRGAFGGEFYGISPRGAASAEASFGYLKKSHWNVQAGLGAISRRDFRSPTLSAALTHCFILNPYKRKQCVPRPGNYLIESYLEGGLGGFLVDRYDNAVYYGSNKQRLLTPSGIMGLRFNVVTGKWIYIFKVRFTPPLLYNDLASRAGVGVAFGWR